MEKYDSIPSLGEQQISSRIFTFLVVVAEVFALTAVIIVGIWMGNFRGGFAWNDAPEKEFNYHPLFMILGMVFLYGNAILVYRVFRNERKLPLKIAHASLQALALLFSGVGLKAVFDSHNLATPPAQNLYTFHSWLGLTTVILFGFHWLLGFVTFLLPFCNQSVRAFFKPIHVYFGVVIFCCAVATALTGLTEKLLWSLKDSYSQYPAEGVLANSLGLLLFILVVTIVFIIVNPNYRRRPLPEEETIQLTN
jgi:cytochrome b-561